MVIKQGDDTIAMHGDDELFERYLFHELEQRRMKPCAAPAMRRNTLTCDNKQQQRNSKGISNSHLARRLQSTLKSCPKDLHL